MALSFEESKKKFMAQTAVQSAEPMIMSMAADDEAFAVMADSASDDYAISGKYTWYSSYRDDKYSSIDELKNIKLDESQINITQEKNSQFIPFQMPRYYDGVDLLDMMLQVHFVNKDGDENYATPVNVTYNSDTIRFGWLIDENVTTVDGEVDFEITATGSNEKGQSYVWKSRPNGKLNILKALTGNGMVEPSGDWYQSFVSLMDEKVASAAAQANAAAQSAKRAQQAVADVDNKISAAASGIKSEIQSDLDTNYAKKTELNALSDKVNGMDGLANFGVDYDSDSNILTIKNF